jgi:four helix bundle protein
VLKKFRSYQLSVQFYHQCYALKLPRHLKDQLSRASSSVSLNLAEGYGKTSFQEKKKFYTTSLASLRECQAVLDLACVKQQSLHQMADHLAGCLYKLVHWSP